jgi:hypothetical protein
MRRLILTLVCVAACAGTVQAQGTIVPEQEYEKKIKHVDPIFRLDYTSVRCTGQQSTTG